MFVFPHSPDDVGTTRHSISYPKEGTQTTLSTAPPDTTAAAEEEEGGTGGVDPRHRLHRPAFLEEREERRGDERQEGG